MLAGQQTWKFDRQPHIISTATIVGPDEAKGPLKDSFDKCYDNLEINEKTWEKAERQLLSEATSLALSKGDLTPEDMQVYVGGDLLNQLITNNFVARELK